MKRTCKNCHTIIELDENNYPSGTIQHIECPGCGSYVDFKIPLRKEEKREEATDDQPSAQIRRPSGIHTYPETHIEPDTAYTGKGITRALNAVICFSVICVIISVLLLIIKTSTPTKIGEANGDFSAYTDEEIAEEGRLENFGGPVEQLLDSTISQHYRGEDIKVLAGEIYSDAHSWPFRLAVKTASKKRDGYDVIYYDITSDVTSNFKAYNEDQYVCFSGKRGETPVMLKLKFDKKTNRWIGTATSNYTLNATLAPSLATFR